MRAARVDHDIALLLGAWTTDSLEPLSTRNTGAAIESMLSMNQGGAFHAIT